jgi:hemolysin III
VALATATVALVIAGGLLYTAGVPFLLAERLPYHNAIWHGFVLVATFVFYAAVTAEMGVRAAAASAGAGGG